jgi:hypothetical protein
MCVTYAITIEGHLHPRWSDWLAGFQIDHNPDGTTRLLGALADQAALYGLIGRLRDMGVTLVALRCIEQVTDDLTTKEL